MTRREHIAPLIAGIIDRVGKDDMEALKAALREAYPYGERKYWPYKVWCDEVRIQLGLKKSIKRRKPPSQSVLCTGQLFQ